MAARELRVAAHDRGAYRSRVLIAGGALLTTAWLLYGLFEFTGQASSTVGQRIFEFQAWAAFLFACGAFTATTDSISREKRDGTLGLLFLTHLKGRDVILGKLIAGLSLFVAGALATLPILTLPLLLGGIRLEQCFALLISLLNTILFSASAGLFASSISVAKQRATGVAAIVVFSFCVAIPLAVLALTKLGFGALPIVFSLQLSTPCFAHQLATGSLTGLQFGYFCSSLAITFSMSCALLAAASAITPRTWQQRAKEPLLKRLTERYAAWTLRTIKSRSPLGRRLLDRNACEWLAARKLSAPTNAWVFIAAIVLLAAGLILNFIRHYDPAGVLITVCMPAAYILQMSVKVRVGGHAADRFVEDRESNAIELILTTPMTLRDMIAGEFRALRRHYILPILAIMGLLLIGFFLSGGGIDHLGGLFSPGAEMAVRGRAFLVILGAFLFIVLDCVALAWAGAWCGLAARKTQNARGYGSALVLAGPLLLFFALGPLIFQTALGRAFLREAGFVNDLLLGVAFLSLCNAAIIFHSRQSLAHRARQRLTEPELHTRDYNPVSWLSKSVARYRGRMRMKRAMPPAAAGSV